jgi:MFS family permease
MNKFMTKDQLYRAWRICLISGCFVMLQFVMQSSTGVMIPHLQRDFEIDIISTSFLSSSYFYPYLLMQIPAGMAADRFGARRTILFSLLFFGVSITLLASATWFKVALVSRIMMGFVAAPGMACSLWLCARWFHPHYFPIAVGVIETLGMAGGALGNSILSYTINTILGWRGSLFILAGLSFLLWCFCYFYIYDSYQQKSVKLDASHRSTPQVVAGLWHILGSAQAWCCGIYSGLTFVSVSGFASFWSVPYCQMRYPAMLADAGNATALMFVGVAIGTPLCGWFSEWLGRRRLVMFLYSSFSLSIILLLLYVPTLAYWEFKTLLFLLGFSASSYVLPFVQMREITMPQHNGIAMGYINMMCIIIGAPFIQPFIGFVLEGVAHERIGGYILQYNLHDYNWALSCLPISIVISLFMILFLKERKRI